eukprot:1335333-Amorphochlora_amoeboformis.AAC.1
MASSILEASRGTASAIDDFLKDLEGPDASGKAFPIPSPEEKTEDTGLESLGQPSIKPARSAEEAVFQRVRRALLELKDTLSAEAAEAVQGAQAGAQLHARRVKGIKDEIERLKK